MIKQLMMASLLTFGTHAAYAQQSTVPPKAGDAQVAATPTAADAKKLIGRNIKNPQNDTIGEIKSVYITPTARSTA